MLSCPGSLHKAVRVEEQQVDDDSRLSLDQRFSGGARPRPSRSRHQSLDRRFTKAAMEDSQAASWSLGQRTIGAHDKQAAAAGSVRSPVPVALSVHYKPDESSKRSDNADESMEHWSTGQRTTIANRRLPTTASATIGTMDNGRQISTTAATTVHATEDSQAVQRSLGQRTTVADHRLPTTLSATVGTVDNKDPDNGDLPLGTSLQGGPRGVNPESHWSTGQRTTCADRRLPITTSATNRDSGQQSAATHYCNGHSPCNRGQPSCATVIGSADHRR